MEVQATTRNVQMSAQKMREVLRQIKGMRATEAQAALAVVPGKGARFIAKTLAAALANAEHLKDDWSTNKIQQMVGELEAQIENTRNHKRRNALDRKLAKFESFLQSGNQLAPEKLWVKEADAGTALTMKRFTPKARGSAGPILKRHCHVKIVLSDG